MNIKICGLNNIEDVAFVASLAPDFLGFVVNCPNSERSISKEQLPLLVANLKVPFVFLFVNQTIVSIVEICKDHRPFAVQLHGDETPDFILTLKNKLPNIQIWKAIHLPKEENNKSVSTYLQQLNEFVSSGCSMFVLDSVSKNAYGGTGITCDWNLASKIVSAIKIPIMLAGGLNPSNVKEAINQVKPFGVDVSSGVEIIKGKKDKDLVRNFIQAIRPSNKIKDQHK